MPAARLPYATVLGAAVCCYAALGAVLSILPHYVSGGLGGGPAAVGLAVGLPALGGLLARPVGGRLADALGPRRPLVAGAAAMTLTTAPALVWTTLAGLLASRLAVGLGEGIMMSATVLWLLRLSAPERRGRGLGHIGLANFAGLALGPLLAAALGGAGAPTAVLLAGMALPLAGAALALASSPPPRPAETAGAPPPARALVRTTAPAGAGLLLVNVGYVALLSFGADAAGLGGLVVPLFAALVVAARTLGGGLPDRLGGRRTVIVFATAEAIGLLAFALAPAAPVAVAGLVALAIGQSLAVPGLGLLALARVAPARQGAAAGLFFAWFDAGVGLGGPATGALASLAGARGALVGASVAVAGAVALTTGGRGSR